MKLNKLNKRAVSPVIAVVLLIAFSNCSCSYSIFCSFANGSGRSSTSSLKNHSK
ncbi:MAG: archaellin/type IV pilin N-terminal domain-containing protein [Candidatus Heimdallarchaeaceae archaeon]